MATAKENDQFTKSVTAQWPLDVAIDWIQKNMTPEHVFDKADLDQWAIDNDYTTTDEDS